VGFGIGNEDNIGLDFTETLTVELEGGDANRVDFTLSGLGGWFDETSIYATKVLITAYGHDGNIIETQGGYRDSGMYDDVYSFETETPVQRFEITSVDNKGTFVVQNMTLTATDTIVTPGHWVNVKEDGAITIDVLKNDSDPDGDALSIVGVDSPVVIDGVEVGVAELVEVNGGQQIRFTPGTELESLSEGESQKVSFEYTVSDGQGGTDTARVNLVVEGVDNAAEVSPSEATEGADVIRGTDEADVVNAQGGDDTVWGESGDDEIHGGLGDDSAWGHDGNDTYVMGAGDGNDYFHGGAGGGWTDTIQLSAAPDDGDNPWQIIVEGEQVEYDLAAGALDLQPDTSGVIKLADGSELAFEGVESIQW
jgi:Ca2+-binding RTX toxin-like protein